MERNPRNRMMIARAIPRERDVLTHPANHATKILPEDIKRKILGPGSTPAVTFLSDKGYSKGIPGYASASIPRWIRAPARITKNAGAGATVRFFAGIAPARNAS